MKKYLLLLALFISSPYAGTSGEVEDTVTSLCNIMRKGVRFLFIGDSITDGGWGRSGGR